MTGFRTIPLRNATGAVTAHAIVDEDVYDDLAQYRWQERFQRAERERDEARDEAARCREARHKATRDAMDAAETWWRKRTGHYRPALEQITARYIAGASAGELADIAFEALRGRDK